MSYYVYILECLDGSWYTGYTNGLVRRFTLHQSAKGAKYTRARGVSHLVVAFECESKTKAMSLEYQIKKLSRKQKEVLVQSLPLDPLQIFDIVILGLIYNL